MQPGKILLIGAMLIATPLVVLAALPTDTSKSTPVANARTCYRGDASTYNPRYEPQESWNTSTGERYNEDDWAAAFQLDIARKERCGFGRGTVCYVAVQTTTGLTAILKINDNGPLRSGSYGNLNRIIDLNEKSMNYLSGGKGGKAQGLIQNVRVCVMEGKNMVLGPINEGDREAWAKKVFSGEYQELPSGAYSPNQYSGLLSNYYNPAGLPQQGGLPTQGGLPVPGGLPTQQLGTIQPGQYFGNPVNSGNTQVTNPTSISATTSGGLVTSSLSTTEYLLQMLRPTSQTGGKTAGTPSLVLTPYVNSIVSFATQGNATTSVSSGGVISTTHATPQTFVQMTQLDPVPGTLQGNIDQTDASLTFRVLESLKNALLRVLETLRLL